MNRVMARTKALLALVLALAIGMLAFLGNYMVNSGNWVHGTVSAGVPEKEKLDRGQIADRDGNLLLDLRDDRTYASAVALRKATIHWLGDRQGNIHAPLLQEYSREITGFDPINGVYAYGDTGGQMILTLSAKLQMAALEAMGDYKGTLAIYNYQTGEILCAVTTPTYDPDNMPDISGDTTGAYEGAFINRFTKSTYTPGSIYKIVTMIAALESLPNLETMEFECTGLVEYGDDKVTCERVHGKQDIKTAFMNSCNCAFAKLSEHVGGIRLERFAKQLGLLDALEFDGISTTPGHIQSANQADVSVAWSAIGQHKDLVNPASFLTLVGAVANGGIGQKPYLVEHIQCGLESTYQAKPVQTQRLMSSQAAAKLTEYMRNNVVNYYGEEQFAGFQVCAKSGTAQVGGGKDPNAMFTGFVVDEDYPFAFFVAIEDGGYGRHVCVPVLEKVLLACREITN